MARRTEGDVEVERYWQHRRELRALARRVSRNPTAAEDIVQETLLRALRNDAGIDKERQGAWLTTVARRLAVDESRLTWRVESRAELVERVDLEADPAIVAEHRQLLADVVVAIGRLTPRQRRLLLAQVAGGISLERLAADEHTTTASVRSVLARAREAIRTSLRDTGWTVAACSEPVLAKVGHAAERLVARLDLLSSRMPRLPGNAAEGLVAAVTAISLLFVPTTPGASPPPHVAAPAAAPDRGSAAPDVVGELQARLPSEVVDTASSAVRVATQAEEQQRLIPFSETEGEIVQFAVAPDQRTVLAQGGYAETAESEASGTLVREWEPVLYRSDDGGRQWHRVAATGFVPGRVLFAPAWPVDPRIFVVTDRGVIRSDDGRSFRAVETASSGGTGAPFHGIEEASRQEPRAMIRSEQRPPAVSLRPAVLSPRFSQGDERIYLGDPAEVLDVTLGTREPIVSSPPWARSLGIAPAADYATSGAVLVGATVRTAVMDERAALFRCTQRHCSEVRRFDDVSEPTGVFASSVDPHLLYVWTTYVAYRSVDGGATWQRQVIGPVVDLVEVGTRLVFLSRSDIPVSDDRGATWRNLRVLYSVTAVAPVGRSGLLLAAGSGLACSGDGGERWQPTCA